MPDKKKDNARNSDDHGHPDRGESTRKYKCGVCGGSGSIGDKTCWNCSGEGEV